MNLPQQPLLDALTKLAETPVQSITFGTVHHRLDRLVISFLTCQAGARRRENALKGDDTPLLVHLCWPHQACHRQTGSPAKEPTS